MESQHDLVRFDWAMKNILRDQANFDILEGFLSELFNEQIKIDSRLDDADQKSIRLDLVAHTANNKSIIVKLQSMNKCDFDYSMLFGASKPIVEYIKKCNPYTPPQIISVNIFDFILGDSSDYIYKGTTGFTGVNNSKDKLQLNDRFLNMYINPLPTYYLIQLKNFTGIVRDKLDQWIYLLRNNAVQDDFDAHGIISAKETLDILKLSDTDRIAYDKHCQNLSIDS